MRRVTPRLYILVIYEMELQQPNERSLTNWLLDLFEALVQAQVVPDGVLPAVRGRPEVWEVLTEKKK